MLGGKTTIETLKGKIHIDIKPGTANGSVLRLKGRGMPAGKNFDTFGDLYATVNIILPDNLTKKELQLFSELASLRNEKE